MMKKEFLLSALTITFLTTYCFADWPQFLGPHRNGTTQNESIPFEFAHGEPEIEWEHSIGNGFSGPVVSNGHVVISHRKGNRAVTDALNIKDGKPVWTYEYETDYVDDFGFDNGPRAVPLIHSKSVFIFGAEGMLHSLDAKSGELIWKRNLRKELGSSKGFFGRTCSPIIIGNTLIIQAGGKGCGIIGLDPAKGTLKWKATDHEAGYASPIASKIGNQKIAILFTRTGFLCIEAISGKVLIEKAHRAKMHASVNAASPVLIKPDEVFLSACYGVGASVWKINPENRKINKLWELNNQLDSHYATPVQFEGHLIGYHGRQETGTEIRCIESSTGKVKWSSERIPAGSITLANKTLIILTERGEMILAPANTDKFKPSARGQILGAETRAMPALSNGRFFARDKKKLVSIKLNP
ncbi:MAG: PQQ-binding-like beta-propeller repeat protein [Verrucomicrobiota bacterium]|nr:PQQ-binding-like beta-propeller repeat protein [Verrucomicrobiota bacterium]